MFDALQVAQGQHEALGVPLALAHQEDPASSRGVTAGPRSPPPSHCHPRGSHKPPMKTWE